MQHKFKPEKRENGSDTANLSDELLVASAKRRHKPGQRERVPAVGNGNQQHMDR
jgi:hypothetical protein